MKSALLILLIYIFLSAKIEPFIEVKLLKVGDYEINVFLQNTGQLFAPFC